jgi:hypothetical protein
LAEVSLAVAIAVGAFAWFGRGFSGRAVAGFALGTAAGLTMAAAATGGLAGNGWLLATVGALLVAALATAAGHGLGPAATAASLAATLAVTPFIGAYDNDWIFRGWPSPRSTMLLVATIALVPLALAGVVAGRSLRAGGGPARRAAALVALAVAAAWCGRVTLPHVLRWGVALLVLAAVAVAGAWLSGRGGHRAELGQ